MAPKETPGENEAAYATEFWHASFVARSLNPIAEHLTPNSVCVNPSKKTCCGFIANPIRG